ncbi:MAG: NifU family protein [Rickettsiales bacterium]|jgi:Fe-S cluster biogenesis protein NfuA|nr:NifU family protein [Rickettsiales bacterium]
MFIQTEQTPNPATLKFLPGRSVMDSGTVDFTTVDEAIGCSPLAERLFSIDGVSAVFLGGDFITITKSADKEWYVMKPGILGAIMEHLTTGQPIISNAVACDDIHIPTDEESEVVGQIKELIETRVRPAVAQDGGDIVFQGFDEGVVFLQLRGACAGCPSSTMTLKMGIENMLKHYIPEVTEVRAAM